MVIDTRQPGVATVERSGKAVVEHAETAARVGQKRRARKSDDEDT